MTENLISPEMLRLMTPEAVTPAALFLVSEEAPRRTILNATAGGVSRTLIHQTEGVFLSETEQTPEAVARLFADISNPAGQALYENGSGQVMKFLGMAAKAATPAPA